MTLDEFISERLEDPKFYGLLQDYLDGLSISRESVNEILDAIKTWDMHVLYEKLFIDLEDLLLEDELEQLITDYKMLFDLPMWWGS